MNSRQEMCNLSTYLLIGMFCYGCSNKEDPILVQLEDVHPKTRAEIVRSELNRPDLIRVGRCSNIDKYWLQGVKDGPQRYFDKDSGALIQDCTYWYCRNEEAGCDVNCPPEGWLCK